MHVLHTSTKHMPPAGDMFTPLVLLVRVAPPVSPCLYLDLAAVFLCLFLLCVLHRRVLAPWFEWALPTRGSPHKESRVAQPCSALCGSSMASRISSGAFNARCSLRFSFSGGGVRHSPCFLFRSLFLLSCLVCTRPHYCKDYLCRSRCSLSRTRRWAFRRVNEETIGVVRRQGNYVEGSVNFLVLRCKTTRSTILF